VQRLHPQALLPQKAHPSDACFDLFSPHKARVEPAQRVALATGLAFEIEEGWEVQLRGRSGLAKRGIEVHFGTVDHLYRLEVKVLVHNASTEPWEIQAGDRIAQLKLERVWGVELVEGEVTPTQRGGLGSTGR
jgi:dUTP pyrophosphatase